MKFIYHSLYYEYKKCNFNIPITIFIAYYNTKYINCVNLLHKNSDLIEINLYKISFRILH